ncbi:MAG: glutamate--cysteine ligase [Gammaproteobacteria bacterium]|nr:glutamate--cysteine ligase [Gammaproteobacteria bacterium]MBT8125024.1 glutamate--cysteine ligase [Gammaproteobacteria bacterium]
MYKQLHNTLSAMSKDQQLNLLTGGRIGIEKECLRVDKNGKLSQQPHPASLGSALTNPYITTDFSEALLELITPPEKGVSAALECLQKIHQFVYSQLEDESLWNASMPCVVAGEDGIPIAQYGSSNSGMMKTVYRRGLGHRYGKMMQAIAGVHFNYSVQENFWPYYRQLLMQDDIPLKEFISEQYFCLIRNLQRYGWVVFYLFGASPAICKSFLSGQPGKLEQYDSNTYYLPFATTLRMGDIGYTNKKESETGVQACYDSLPSYIKCLTKAIETSCPEYEKIGIKVDGEYRQLNANILQIENEYYSTIRPKQPLVKNEKPVHALGERGVQYIELRSLDLNLYDPLGVSDSQLYFLEAFMLFCLLHESQLIDRAERKAVEDNESKVAHQGRDPALKLSRKSEQVSIQTWGSELLIEMQAVCTTLDEQNSTTKYSKSLQKQLAAIEDSNQTPSARILQDMHENQECFFELANRISRHHEKQLRDSTLSEKDMIFFQNQVRQSVEKQGQIEASDTISFDQFLHNYFSNTVSEQEVKV